MVVPVTASRHHSLPDQSGTYSLPLETVGVAVTSDPAAVKVHLGVIRAMFETLRVVSPYPQRRFERS
jgi:hypothetical protein